MADEFNINEWLLDEYIAKRDALTDLTRRHEEIVNTLADICRRNDRMLAVGNKMAEILNCAANKDPWVSEEIDKILQQWGEANV